MRSPGTSENSKRSPSMPLLVGREAAAEDVAGAVDVAGLLGILRRERIARFVALQERQMVVQGVGAHAALDELGRRRGGCHEGDEGEQRHRNEAGPAQHRRPPARGRARPGMTDRWPHGTHACHGSQEAPAR